MNVAAHQEKEKNEKTGKKKAGEERRLAYFKEAARYPSAIQGAARRKNGSCEESARGNWDPRESQQLFQPNPNGVGDRTTTLRRLLICAVNFARFTCTIYTTEISHFTIQKDRSQYVF